VVDIGDLVDQGALTPPTSPKGTLLRAATHLFRTKGYDRTTVRDLAKEVGIQSGSLFHHFKSKEDILAAVMGETIVVCTQRMHDALIGRSSAPDKLLALLECEIQSVLGEHGDGLGVLVFEWNRLSEEKRPPILELREEYERLWLDTLVEADRDGLLSIDPAMMRRFLLGALSWIVNWYNPNGKLTVEDLAQNALRMILGKQSQDLSENHAETPIQKTFRK